MHALDVLKVRVAAQYRREVPVEEKKAWIKECRKLLQEKGKDGTQQEIAEILGLSVQWVSKYDDEPIQRQDHSKDTRRVTFSNVWGLKSGEIQKGDPDQPDSQFLHSLFLFFLQVAEMKSHLGTRVCQIFLCRLAT